MFRDPFALDWLDESEEHGEDRYAIIGIAEGRLLYVAYTMRGETIRIISAEEPSPMNDDNTMKTTPKTPKHDWSRSTL